MTHTEIFARLKELAPNVVFSTSRELDRNDVWDGDCPDPREEGYDAYDIIVKAETILMGESVEGAAYLGSSYYLPDEEIGDVHGYLPQMLREAVEELKKLVDAWREKYDGKELIPAAEVRISLQLDAAEEFLSQEMKDRYDAQRKECCHDKAHRKGTKVYGQVDTPFESVFGLTTGSTRTCQLDGCGADRIYVRWPDGHVTMPCEKGLVDGPEAESLRIA